MEGRSDPTNASQLRDFDFDGVQCGFCHQLFDPFYADSYAGVRESNDWLNYWDETNASGSPSQPAADRTFAADAALAASIRLFNNAPFYQNDQPFSSGYTENAAGQYFISPDRQKRGPFADANARHPILYSRYHKSKYFCSTCHDVSNPVLANLGADPSQPLPSETDPAFSYYHVERTFSEFILSAYGQEGGAPGLGPYAPAAFTTSLANNYISACQDCHMRDVVGQASWRMRPPVRPNQSVEHPQSGMPLHDLTGGNAWVSTVLASTVPNSPNYDPTNESLLKQGPDVLTLDLSQGSGIDANALLAGAGRAIQQLEQAASFEAVVYDPASGQLSLRIQNQTGHKLISGFPEGRRMFLNVKAFNGTGQVIYELNPYDYSAGTLRGLDPAYAPSSPPLQANQVHLDEFVYEMKPTSSLTGEAKSFHFALATGRYKDNRIPPVGFDSAAASERLAEPVWHGASDPAYFTAEEYAGGYDAVTLQLPQGAQRVEINLYYQITSREYMEFLRDEINGEGNLTLSSPTLAGEPEAYIVQTDPHFRQLKAWG
ncbi:MAG TPA: hypothetical protein VLS48_01990, partial [Anaerolineales bacterium]|nr:hypothetical protein [Anaerolineales bacterium]